MAKQTDVTLTHAEITAMIKMIAHCTLPERRSSVQPWNDLMLKLLDARTACGEVVLSDNEITLRDIMLARIRIL